MPFCKIEGKIEFPYCIESSIRVNLQFQLPDNPDLVVASDVHVRLPDDQRALALQNLIDEAFRVKAKNFVLNGDIFDFFFGWGGYFTKKFSGIFGRLERLSESGCEVVFVEGNHEFGMDRMKTKGIRYLDSYGLTITTKEGLKVLILHGDLMKEDFKYQIFRSVVRSKLVSFVAAITPQVWLDKATLWFAGTSRKKDQYRVLKHDRILALARRVLEHSKPDHLIFGHFHHPYDEVDAVGRKVLSVDSWDKPSCIVLKDKVFTRVFGQSPRADKALL